ncbi:MAG: citrate (Si)-synthase [Actinobacteria bacterium]|nr:citrate (Si)-synthase [Actinomycetota bacterium]
MADTITIIDDRTGKKVTVPVTDGVFASSALRELDPNLRMYDPAFLSTAACASSITYLDGDAGILRYRGYPIEQLAEHSTFLEVAYLLLNGELPTTAELDKWTFDVTHHTMIHENMRKRFVDGFHYDAHPMGMFISAVAALGTFYNSAKRIFDEDALNKQILRLVAKVPTIAAMTYRFSKGLPFVLPNNSMNYSQNFLNMMYRIGDDYRVDPTLARAMDVLFILHADHEQNCGTTTMRVVASANADPYSSVAAAAAALYGPLHGGANEAVVRMLAEIGTVNNVPAFIKKVKDGDAKLMGFGHRVYKNFDPRATIIKKTAYVIYQALGFPVEMFTVLFAIPRTVGWLAHMSELLKDKEQKISRPRQWYTGVDERPYVAIGKR